MDQQIDSYHHFTHQQPFCQNSTECSLLLDPCHSPNSSLKHSLLALHQVMSWMVTGITTLNPVAPKPTHMVSQSSTTSTPGMVSGNILVTGSGSNSVQLFPHSPFSFLLTFGLWSSVELHGRDSGKSLSQCQSHGSSALLEKMDGQCTEITTFSLIYDKRLAFIF